MMMYDIKKSVLDNVESKLFADTNDFESPCVSDARYGFSLSKRSGGLVGFISKLFVMPFLFNTRLLLIKLVIFFGHKVNIYFIFLDIIELCNTINYTKPRVIK